MLLKTCLHSSLIITGSRLKCPYRIDIVCLTFRICTAWSYKLDRWLPLLKLGSLFDWGKDNLDAFVYITNDTCNTALKVTYHLVDPVSPTWCATRWQTGSSSQWKSFWTHAKSYSFSSLSYMCRLPNHAPHPLASLLSQHAPSFPGLVAWFHDIFSKTLFSVQHGFGQFCLVWLQSPLFLHTWRVHGVFCSSSAQPGVCALCKASVCSSHIWNTTRIPRCGRAAGFIRVWLIILVRFSYLFELSSGYSSVLEACSLWMRVLFSALDLALHWEKGGAFEAGALLHLPSSLSVHYLCTSWSPECAPRWEWLIQSGGFASS